MNIAELLTQVTARRCYRLSITATPLGVRHVRRIVRAHLRLWGMPSLVDAAVLGVTELLTNVIRHVSEPSCTVVLLRRTHGIRIEVHDSDPALPTPRQADDLDDGGRGLALLSAYACAWGAERSANGGKVVWFELEAGAE